MKRLFKNLLIWFIYSMVSLIPSCLILGMSLQAIGLSIIIGFFAGMFNDILYRLIEIRDILNKDEK